MSDFILVIQVILGLFSIYGICEFVRRFIDMYVICRSEAVCKITLESCDDAEYSIRFIESRFLSGDYADLFDGLVISENVCISNEDFDKLDSEFGNISKQL